MPLHLDYITEARRGGEQTLRSIPCATKQEAVTNLFAKVLKRTDVLWWTVLFDEEKRGLVEQGAG
jgi:hypothetical protein